MNTEWFRKLLISEKQVEQVRRTTITMSLTSTIRRPTGRLNIEKSHITLSAVLSIVSEPHSNI